MNEVNYVRVNARLDEITVTNNDQQTSTVRSEEPVRMWLRLPDTTAGELKLMEYNWDTDSWSEYVPE